MIKRTILGLTTALLIAGAAVQAEARSNATCDRRCDRTYEACSKACGPGITGAKCETGCNNARDACQAQCEDSGTAYRDCIKNAGSDERKRKACIDGYRDTWGTNR